MKDLSILTISGWTQPADSLARIAPDAEHLDYAHAASVEEVAERLRESKYDLVIGWSLGGILARQLMHRHGLQAQLLVSLAAPFQFVRDEKITEAMPRETFDQFYENYRSDAARTSKRFHGLLAKNDKHHKRILGELSHHPKVHEVEAWLPWMDFLSDYSAYAHDYHALAPTLIIHGKEDAIIPVRQANFLHEHLPDTQLKLIEGCGHAPHHHDAEYMKTLIHDAYEEAVS